MTASPAAPLPVDEAIPALRDALRRGTAAVLQAPPGAGKTTRVPLALLDEPWLAGRRIVMLEPRRIATRAAARRMSATLAEAVGDTVGYRVRMESRVGPRTRVEVVTEGILTRRIQRDPELADVGLLIFDEFHERSIHADLGLALALQTQEVLRDDLRILVMSATLDGAAVARLLGDAPVITSEGRQFPVELRWTPPRDGQRIEGATASAVREALRRETGDVLVFLPGAGEIRRTVSMLEQESLPAGTRVLPLFGDLPPAAQDEAIAPSAPGTRKVVVATSIAETSLTIEGVRVVVDAGLARVPRFSPRTGMTRLATVKVTRAAAEQRRGRAGRVAPGSCYRLWAEHEHGALLERQTPELLETDLAPLALELAAAGVREPSSLRWLDAPPPAALALARELLVALGAVDAEGRITERGARMAELPLHPRLAHMVLEGVRLGLAPLACELAAILGDRDVLRAVGGRPGDADLRLRIEAMRGDREVLHGLAVDREAVRRARAEARDRMRRLGVPPRGGSDDVDECGTLLAFAYPDRIARRRTGQPGRFLLRNGAGAALAGEQTLTTAEFLVAAELDGRGGEARVYLAAPVTLEELERHHDALVEHRDVVTWDDDAQGVRAVRERRIGAILLGARPLAEPDATEVARLLREAIASRGIAALPWRDGARRLRDRLGFLRHHDDRWPDVGDDALLRALDEWLIPHLEGKRRWSDVERLDLGALLLDLVPWELRARLDELAPTHVTVPTGSRIPVDYADPAAPSMAVRLQELFGLADGPRVLGGRVPLTLELLSPAQRPVQVTRDLAGFWRTSYFDVRKDLRGRYPRHPWPDDPLAAAPTRRAKPRG